jgi:hypothetical protein
MLRIGLAADSHGDWAALDGWAAAERLDLIVHCGDCGIAPGAGIPVLAARGNHEQSLASNGERPRFVPDYERRTIDSLSFLFLGCCSVAGAVAAPPAELAVADVVISHEAPFNPQLGWAWGHPVVRAVVERSRPAWCFSGHWHHLARGAVGATTCWALGADRTGWLVAELDDGTLRLCAGR